MCAIILELRSWPPPSRRVGAVLVLQLAWPRLNHCWPGQLACCQVLGRPIRVQNHRRQTAAAQPSLVWGWLRPARLCRRGCASPLLARCPAGYSPPAAAPCKPVPSQVLRARPWPPCGCVDMPLLRARAHTRTHMHLRTDCALHARWACSPTLCLHVKPLQCSSPPPNLCQHNPRCAPPALLTPPAARPQVAAHLQRSNALLLMHRRNPRALANTAWALAKLGHDPGLPWISQFLLASS